jgi:predicted AAA+ superfamily ATPase
MRYVAPTIDEFAREKMVFVSGPRQVGKTTLAKEWLAERGEYLNWDVAEDRRRILTPTFASSLEGSAVVLDEVHKYARWKSLVKGLYDKRGRELQIVVTGSARLDLFQRGGDSLLGRYELVRLHPLSVGELADPAIRPPPANWLAPARVNVPDVWPRLEARGGFPEPYYRDDARQHRRWSTRRREALVREDLRELSQIRTLSLVEHLSLLLPSRVGSPLSINALREEVQVAFDTAKNWLEALERLYFCFRISPWSKRVARSLRKETKLYLWDWSEVEDDGARFENMVASHLLKAVHAWNDLGHGRFALQYWRDVDGREVDFVVSNGGRAIVAIECKHSDATPSADLLRLGDLLGIPQVQLVAAEGVDERRKGVRLVTAADYLAALV